MAPSKRGIISTPIVVRKSARPSVRARSVEDGSEDTTTTKSTAEITLGKRGPKAKTNSAPLQKKSKTGAEAKVQKPNANSGKNYLNEDEVDRRIQKALANERVMVAQTLSNARGQGGIDQLSFDMEAEVAKQVSVATQVIQAKADKELAEALGLNKEAGTSMSANVPKAFRIPKLPVAPQDSETDVESDESGQPYDSDSEDENKTGDLIDPVVVPKSIVSESRGKRDPHPPPASFWQDNTTPPAGMAPIAGNERNFGAIKSKLRQETDRLTSELRQSRFPTNRVAVHNRILTTHLEEVARVVSRARMKLECVSSNDPALQKAVRCLEQANAGLGLAKRATVHEVDVARLADSHGMAVVTASEARTSVTKGLAERSQFVLKQLKQAEVDAATLARLNTSLSKNVQSSLQPHSHAEKKRARKPTKVGKSSKCFNCQGYGHLARDCKLPKA